MNAEFVGVTTGEGLPWNQEAVFSGLLRFKSRRGDLRPELRVNAVGEAGVLRLSSKDELLERWSAAAARPKRDARAALEWEQPRLTVVTGVGSVAVDDIPTQLREAEAELRLDVVRVPMSRPGEVARAVRQAAAHAVVLTRGGGRDVDDLDADELIGAVAASPVPVLVALGHASDDLVVARVADAAFPTPTAWAPGYERPSSGSGSAPARSKRPACWPSRRSCWRSSAGCNNSRAR